MNPVSEDVKDILVANSVGVFNATTGWGIFTNYRPQKPDTAIIIYDLAGRDEPTMDKTHVVRYDPVQIVVRGLESLAAYSKASTIKAVLRADSRFILNETLYHIFRNASGPYQGERDDQERLSWVLTIEAVREAV
jgi:hypothetical protein